MPVTSHQINQMIAGQQAMFGNTATYAQQISPMGQAMGVAPTYANPYGPMMSPGAQEFNQGVAAAPGMMNAAASYGAPIVAGAGMMMGGTVGRMLDPFSGAMGGFARGVGWRSGAGIGSNLGMVARGGLGGIARGIGMGALGALPALGLYHAGSYAVGQMAQGAQFQNQVGSMLQNTFRFTNPESRTGYGFGQVEQRQVGQMLQTMGSKDMMSTPSELLGIMGRGAQMGVFRGVQDAREFRQRFTKMKDTLTEIAKTFNTTLSEALPFFQQARQQGFWTPQDITRHAAQVRQVQANTGMSAQQSQAVMGMGAQMARRIGGTGQQGSQMMARAQMMGGAALFGNVVSSRTLGEAGFGTGAEGAQNLGTMLAGATARFARSRVGRWALASMMDREGTGLDPAKLQRFMAGGMSVGEIGRSARRNVSGRRAYQFVGNEGELRGKLAAQGPQAALGIVRSLTGSRLWGGGARDRLVTRRIIQRFMGGNRRQADIVAKLAREMPRMMQIQAARSEASIDAQGRQREEQMANTYEGFKRRIGQWWRQNIDGPLREAGADFSYQVGRTWQRFSDRLLGTGGRERGISAEAVRAMVRSAETGNRDYLSAGFGPRDIMDRELGQIKGGYVGQAGSAQMMRLGFRPVSGSRSWASRGATIGMGLFGAVGAAVGGAAGWAGQRIFGRGRQFSLADIREREALGRASRGMVGVGEARALGFGGTEQMREALGGAGAQQVQKYLRGAEVLNLRGRMGMGALGQEEQEQYATQVIQRIQQGRAGGQAQQLFAGLSGRKATARLMAMQGKARGEFTGFTGLEGLPSGGQARREAIEKYEEGATEELAGKLLSARDIMLGGEEVPERGIEELKKDSRGKRAMLLFARARAIRQDMKTTGKGDPDKAKRLEDQARGLLREVSRDGSTSERMRDVAIRMQDPNNPQAEVIADLMGKLGASAWMKDRQAVDDTLRRRKVRFRKTLGEGIDLIRTAGGGDTSLTQAFTEAMSTGGLTPSAQLNRLSRLAQAAADDPEKARRMSAILQEKGLSGTDIGLVLSGASRVKEEAQDFGISRDIEEGEKISRKAKTGIHRRLAQLGISGLSQKELRKVTTGLIRGTDTSMIRERLKARGYEEEDIDRMVGEMRGGLTVGEQTRIGVKRAVSGAVKSYSVQVAKRAGLDPQDLSAAGIDPKEGKMVTELKTQTVKLNQVVEYLGAISRDEKIPKKGKKSG